MANVAELVQAQANVHRVLTIPEGDALVDAAQYFRKLCLATTWSRLEPIGVHLSYQADTLPLEPERSLAIFEWYLPEADHTALAAKKSVEFSHQIQIEDVAICEAVQKNLRSRSYSRGRFSVKQEKGVHAFHRMYAEMMQKD